MAKQYQIRLTEEERKFLKTFTATEGVNARNFARARALLLLDRSPEIGPAWSLEQTETAIGLSCRTLITLKEKFVVHGLDAVFGPRKTERVGRPCRIDEKVQDKIIKLARKEPPKGHDRWTVRLLKKHIEAKKIVDKISVMSVQRVLKKRNFKLTETSVD